MQIYYLNITLQYNAILKNLKKKKKKFIKKTPNLIYGNYDSYKCGYLWIPVASYFQTNGINSFYLRDKSLYH